MQQASAEAKCIWVMPSAANLRNLVAKIGILFIR